MILVRLSAVRAKHETANLGGGKYIESNAARAAPRPPPMRATRLTNCILRPQVSHQRGRAQARRYGPCRYGDETTVFFQLYRCFRVSNKTILFRAAPAR